MSTCEEPVYGPHTFAGTPCRHTATVDEDGKRYCWQHDPSKVAARVEARRERILKKLAIEQAELAVAAAERQVVTEAKAWCMYISLDSLPLDRSVEALLAAEKLMEELQS